MASPAPTLLRLKAELEAAFAEFAYKGIMGDARHCPGPSDHCDGNALDFWIPNHAIGAIREKIEADARCYYTICGQLGQPAGHRSHWRGHSKWNQGAHGSHCHVSIVSARRHETHSWGIADVAGGTSPPAPSSSFKPGPAYWDANASDPIKRGHRGDGVKHVQDLLASFGYSVGASDALFGERTEAAVRAFQGDAGVGVDGMVGPATRAQLEDRHYRRGRWEPIHPGYPGRLLRRGIYNDAAVRTAQQRLADRGWRVSVDGDFGPQTERVVKMFQREKGLGVDGVVGPQTWEALWVAPITS